MSTAGHGGLSSRALSRTHAVKPISRHGAKKHLNHIKWHQQLLNITPKPCCYRCYKICIMADVSAL